ncbi:MAG: hypothetical protein ACK44L_14965 [Burkholderiales bacterium]
MTRFRAALPLIVLSMAGCAGIGGGSAPMLSAEPMAGAQSLAATKSAAPSPTDSPAAATETRPPAVAAAQQADRTVALPPQAAQPSGMPSPTNPALLHPDLWSRLRAGFARDFGASP